MCEASAFWTYALSQVDELIAVLSGTLTPPAACPELPEAPPPPDDEVVLLVPPVVAELLLPL